MATPARLIELQCPTCNTSHWEIDRDFRKPSESFIDFTERTYSCPGCGQFKSGYAVLQKSPPTFFLQPHPMYPMKRKEFEYWAGILQTNFPDLPIVRELGHEFTPNTQILFTRLRNIYFTLALRARRKYQEWKWYRSP